VTQKLSIPDKLYVLPPNLRISGHLPAPIVNGEEIAAENGQIADFQGLMTLTMTLDRVILHTVMHQSLNSTYTQNFIEIEETSCGRLLTENFKVP